MVDANGASPVVNAKNSNVSFSLSLDSIAEIDSNNVGLTNYSLQTGNITMYSIYFLATILFILIYASFQYHKLELFNQREEWSQYPKIWAANLSYIDRLKAVLISFLSVQSTTNFTFANQTFTLQPQSIKLTIEVFNWPFQNVKNKVEISMRVDHDVAVCFSMPKIFRN